MSNLQEKSQDAGATEEWEKIDLDLLEMRLIYAGVGEETLSTLKEYIISLLQAAERRGMKKALDILFKEGEMYRFIDYQGEQWVHNSFYNDMIRGRGEVLETLTRLTDKRIMEGE